MEWGARLHSEAMPCSRPRSGLHEMPLMRAAAGFGASRWVRLDRPCPAPPPSQACARPTSRLARLPAAGAAIHCDCVILLRSAPLLALPLCTRTTRACRGVFASLTLLLACSFHS
jgi:hypothetical protein